MSSFTNTPNFDNLLLQTLMTRLQIRPTNPPPFLNQTTLEDLLAVTVNEHHICVGFHRDAGSEYRVWEWHGHVMLFDEENGYSPEYIYGNYFEVVKGDKVSVRNDDDDEKVEEKIGSLGLRELIGSGDSGSGRVVHRNVNAGSPRLKLLRLHLCLLCSQFSDYLKQFDVAGSPKNEASIFRSVFMPSIPMVVVPPLGKLLKMRTQCRMLPYTVYSPGPGLALPRARPLAAA
ncbi:hypothetical protein C3L33_20268, partial [Rhododendron williamsianum]